MPVTAQNCTAHLDICHQSNNVHKLSHAKEMDVFVYQNINARVDMLMLAKWTDKEAR